MIGLAHEPPRDVLDQLQAELGDGAFQLRYADLGNNRVHAVITLHGEQSPTLTVPFAGDATREQVDAVWRAEVTRFAADRKGAARAGGAADDRATHEEAAPERVPAEQPRPDAPPQPAPDAPPSPPTPPAEHPKD